MNVPPRRGVLMAGSVLLTDALSPEPPALRHRRARNLTARRP
jgi:hypothetical protein